MHRVVIIVLFFSCSVFSQFIEKKALPRITHYDTKSMGFNTQSWDIGQDETGLIYVANGGQVLIFDGTKWESVNVGSDIVNRNLFVKNKDSIYFGADGQYGVLVNQQYTDYKVVPLGAGKKDAISEVEEYWRAHYVNDEVVFQTFRNLYVNQGNIVTKIPAPYRFKWSYIVNDELYVNDLKYGVFKLQGTNLMPIVSDQKLNENIIGVTSLNENLVIITDTKGIFKLIGDTLIPFEFSELDAIKKAQIFSFLKLHDNRIAIGTVSNGLYILDLETGEFENINKKSGLQNNTVLSIYQDSESNLWLALDYGIDFIKLNSSLKYFYDYYGEFGTTYAVLKDKDLLYLGTNQGLYLANTNEPNPEFELLLNGQVWNIEKVDDQVFIGHDNGAYLANGDNLTRIGEDLGSWNFRAIKDESNGFEGIISGNYSGVSFYEKTDQKWSGYKLKGFEKSTRYVEIDVENNIWLTIRSEGVFKFKFDYANKEIKKLAFYSLNDFGGSEVSMSKVDNEIVITSDYHKYTYLKENNTFDKVIIGENRGRAPRIFKKGQQTWYLDNQNVAIEDKQGVTVLHELRDQLIPDILNAFSVNESSEIIPVFNGFSVYTKNGVIIPESVKNNLLIMDFVSVNSQKSYDKGAEIPFSDNDLKINYALPVYGQEVLYQTKLNDDEWGSWTTSTEQTLFNITEGDYSFNIRAKYKENIEEASFEFKIKPPIYRTPWAYLLYLLLFLLLVITTVSFNRYKMKKQERMLLQQKAEKLQKQEEEHKAQKLEQEHKIIELNNAKLQDEIKAKSRELTQIAYVNLNKNKILKKIRNKIIKVQESSEQKLPTNSYNELIRLVEYYITNKESKLFEINFDKSHQEFYEKLSKKYPNLTSKDLRLCAYLKMNLSSKEIAPLLGISSQSVDVSRHRLRKKLTLDSKDNLINILISLK
ncbi:hypothetical protein AWE51_16965 [Aquimarina aggregata]|uniref:HTH luxR-type domain-containing protein n=2 Tax=Aquimarina aggregata TaxID=1642818 RepID=A0A163D6J5_9FLAO|nr:hypothetical protein AWE51_16965 [Aquimarina aggregata]